MKVSIEMPKCVVGFDVWGTLLDLEETLKMLAEAVSKRANMSLEQASKFIFRVHSEMKAFRRRSPSLKPRELLEYSRKALLQALNISEELLEDAFNEAFSALRSHHVVFHDVISALEALKSRGVRMGIIGNVLFWPSTYTTKLLESVGVLQCIEHAVFSDNVGVSKPDREIFLLFSRAMNVEPEDIIYVGDSVVEDIGGALASGAVGVLINRGSRKYVILPELRVAIIHNMTQLTGVYEAFCQDRA